eukprot:14690542-Alexandrium_andersonii.AAC.1
MNLFLPWWAPHVRHRTSRETTALTSEWVGRSDELLQAGGEPARCHRLCRLLPDESPTRRPSPLLPETLRPSVCVQGGHPARFGAWIRASAGRGIRRVPTALAARIRAST